MSGQAEVEGTVASHNNSTQLVEGNETGQFCVADHSLWGCSASTDLSNSVSSIRANVPRCDFNDKFSFVS